MLTRLLPCALCVTIIACGNQPDFPEPNGQSGKGDTNESRLSKRYSRHVPFDTAQELYTTHLRQLCCSAIAKKQPWSSTEHQAFRMRCKDKDFVSVKRTAKWTSKLYDDNDNSEPLVMRMAVTVKYGDKSWDVTLQRRYSPKVFRLYWEATHSPDPNDPDIVNRNFIRELAEDLGEYFEYPDGPWDDRLRGIGVAQIPASLNAHVMAKVEAETEMMEGTDSAFLGEEHQEILDASGQVIGYVIHIEYYIDHTLFDGGGLHVYYNLNGHVIEEVEWWG